MSIITLTTDFGLIDAYVGSLHGVILSINPKARIVDMTHSIPSYNIAHGAFVVGTAYRLYPRGTIHVAVVDPFVGGPRRGIVIETKDYLFVGPDNGVFSLVAEREVIRGIFELTNPRFFRPRVSPTFHARDIFTPVAAHLSLGASPRQAGRKLKGMVRLAPFSVEVSKDQVSGHIMAIDKFGNAVTSIHRGHLRGAKDRIIIRVGRHRIQSLAKTYSDVGPGNAAAVIGSSDYLELAVNQGHLAQKWKLKVGQVVKVRMG